ncbi:potassium-transporting ATPase subunit KdpC [Pasteurellaceae bacterium 20609_3]|uniref:potassium-transporting ATPase subunit KdpC n=1 Tax=Spirabiliibacterium mucosae TaxID=28156 RepID=UPI001AAE17B6|nr:potassium-transporting ATPase subunit KdpC [Spirabiliibacterium mucosae]MBE2898248.1 potassium-transporting ATPase subunit KdpC [Spirabiliibacterium mucosae]
MKSIVQNLRPAIVISLLFMAICGLGYPLAMTALSSWLFPDQAKGSLVMVDGQAVGARYVGQQFDADYYLWSRPSAVGYNMYDEKNGEQVTLSGDQFEGVSSGSDNYAPSNPELKARVAQDLQAFLARNPDIKQTQIPADLLTASGSGLDPDISPEAAAVQVPRIVKASGLSEQQINQMIANNTSGKLFGVFGADTVNVLAVNLEIAKAMGLIK